MPATLAITSASGSSSTSISTWATSLVGRLTRSARRVTLHLPARWPWATDWTDTTALARLRTISLLV